MRAGLRRGIPYSGGRGRGAHETCPLSTRGRTRRVQLVQGEGGGGAGGPVEEVVIHLGGEGGGKGEDIEVSD